ncbi:MAG: Multifunctional CCA protein [Candidatus Dependentiae bacterium ADurb.Bin331]|nr:MAG: Multifunctional CCA protein [Candidatus Dependentiae bacterium ADurb.Bin331]
MQYTKVDENIQKRASDILAHSYPLVLPIVHELSSNGCQTVLVGGAVRDLFLNLPLKDIDIEVYNCSLDELETRLKNHGPVSLVGKVYGVLRLHGLDVDWSVPRSDSSGRKPQVKIDPHLSFEKAFARRDLTINAMGIDLATFQLIDPFNGLADLHKKIARAPDPHFFVEDPLRFFRVMQFVARFDLTPDEELNRLCSQMDISTVSRERIEQEFAKLFLRSKKPSRGFLWLDSIKRLADVLPELAATKGIEQEKKWHPEGDVYEHTLQAIDAAAALHYRDEHEKLAIMYAALCHDLGKVNATQIVDGSIKSYGHAQESEVLTKKMLKRITHNKELVDTVSKLVHYHMEPIQFVKSGAKAAAYKRLARKLAPEVTLEMLGLLACADKQGRNSQKGSPLTTQMPEIEQFFEHARDANVLYEVEQPVLHGRDLLDIFQPGPDLGKAVKYAYFVQINEGIKDKQELIKRIKTMKQEQIKK